MRLNTAQIIIISLTSFFIACNGKQDNEQVTNWKISVDKLEQHTAIMAHDTLEGRGAGYTGELKAAKYIAANFREFGLSPAENSSSVSLESYLQRFEFHVLGSEKAWERRQSQNVVGFIEGAEKPTEYIVIGAHYDGQGMKGQNPLGRDLEGVVTDSLAAANDTIWNSAVDNAISISAMMEIARILMEEGIKPQRSILFVAFGAEESALDGSVHFVNNSPISPSSIKAMINLEKLVGDPEAEFLYVSYGTSPIFEKIRMESDSVHGADLTPFFPDIIADTDHYPFTQRKIPAITMGTGSEINVHSSLDHSNRVDYELLSARTKYILNFLINIANTDTDFSFTGDLSGLYGITGGPATKKEMEEFSFSGNTAFKVSAVVSESKGDILGVRPGDLIVAINDEPLDQIPYILAFEDLLIEDIAGTIKLTIARDKKILSILLPE